VIKDIAFTAYPAADVAALRAFYVDTLGIPLGPAMAGEDGTAAYCEAQVGASYFALLLDSWIERPKGSGAGVVFEVDDLATLSADLRAKGFAVSEPMEFPNCKLANFEDPEGNKVSLHETRAS